MLIGMVSLTVLGSTTHLEQKQKPVFKVEQSIYVNAINVESNANFKGFSSESRQNSINCIVALKNDNLTLNQSYTALLDVGWHFNKGFNYIRHYKEKLNPSYRFVGIQVNKNRVRNVCTV